MNNFTRYKEALKARYEGIKNETHSNFLLHPTWAGLRNLCIQIYRDNDDKNDKKTFELFFEFKLEVNTKQKIIDQTNKFRPLVTFLRNETELSDIIGADLIAVLLDYEFRPYNRFINLKEEEIATSKAIEYPEEEEANTNTLEEEDVEMDRLKDSAIPFKPENELTSNEKLPVIKEGEITKWDEILRALLLVCIIAVLGFLSYSTFFPDKQCLQWQDDHFEIISCDNLKVGEGGIEPYSEGRARLRKIIPNKETKPFINAKPNLWYGRGTNGKTEYFNAPGPHPLTNIELHAITREKARDLYEDLHPE
jgi:hypothetical protein